MNSYWNIYIFYFILQQPLTNRIMCCQMKQSFFFLLQTATSLNARQKAGISLPTRWPGLSIASQSESCMLLSTSNTAPSLYSGIPLRRAPVRESPVCSAHFSHSSETEYWNKTFDDNPESCLSYQSRPTLKTIEAVPAIKGTRVNSTSICYHYWWVPLYDQPSNAFHFCNASIACVAIYGAVNIVPREVNIASPL
jgi:hypothetical protein